MIFFLWANLQDEFHNLGSDQGYVYHSRNNGLTSGFYNGKPVLPDWFRLADCWFRLIKTCLLNRPPTALLLFSPDSRTGCLLCPLLSLFHSMVFIHIPMLSDHHPAGGSRWGLEQLQKCWSPQRGSPSHPAHSGTLCSTAPSSKNKLNNGNLDWALCATHQ